MWFSNNKFVEFKETSNMCFQTIYLVAKDRDHQVQALFW